MAEESAKLRIPYIAAAQAQKHVTHNEGMTLLDTLVQLSVIDKDLTAPPGSPSEGDTYIVAGAGGTATGAWVGWEKRIARFIDGMWRSYLAGVGAGAGWIAYVIDESTLYVFSGTVWQPVQAGSSAVRNHIVNPLGAIAQAPLGATADGVYCGFDQWLALTQSNPVTSSQLTDIENGMPFAMRLTQSNASAQRFGLIQPIEKAMCRHLRGDTIRLEARVRMSAATKLRYAVLEWTGTADAIGSGKDVVNDWTSGTFTTGNFFKSTTTSLVAAGSVDLLASSFANISLAGSVSGSMNNLLVFFWTDTAQAQSVTLDVAKVQLVRGANPIAPFAARPLDDEIRLCKRYYVKMASGDTGDCYFSKYSNDFEVGTAEFTARMRVAPTVTLLSIGGTTGAVSVPGGADISGVAAANIGTERFTTVSKTGAFGAAPFVEFGYVADARL
jgi:hypothetical protein